MTGLPGADAASDLETADKLIALQPDTARVYPSLVLEETEFAEEWRFGRYQPQTLEEAVNRCSDLLERFTAHGIRVIRLGLHNDPNLAGAVLAGPYHPAFRELCEGKILLQKVLAALKTIPLGSVTLHVAPGSTSKMAGQKRCNLIELERLGYRVRIVEDNSILYLGVEVSR
jgi:histone acetyltransferase (RNA polymerase elongator complex component)